MTFNEHQIKSLRDSSINNDKTLEILHNAKSKVLAGYKKGILWDIHKTKFGAHGALIDALQDEYGKMIFGTDGEYLIMERIVMQTNKMGFIDADGEMTNFAAICSDKTQEEVVAIYDKSIEFYEALNV